jgi:hypothetical protein
MSNEHFKQAMLELSMVLAKSEPSEHPFVTSAKKHFGTTQDIKEAGYITPDGSMLDLSGRHYSKDHPSLKGHRNVDHRELPDDIGGGTDAMIKFQGQTGTIRHMPETRGIDVTQMPTHHQLMTLALHYGRDKEPLLVDITHPETGDTVKSFEVKPSYGAMTAAFNNHFNGNGPKGGGLDKIATGLETYMSHAATEKTKEMANADGGKAEEKAELEKSRVSHEEVLQSFMSQPPNKGLAQILAEDLIGFHPAWSKETVHISKLKQNPRARVSPEGSKSTGPIIVDSKFNVKDGNHRLREAIARGDTHIEIYRPLKKSDSPKSPEEMKKSVQDRLSALKDPLDKASQIGDDDLNKMSRPRIGFPNFPKLNTRPDQEVQPVETTRQKEIFGRKVVNAQGHANTLPEGKKYRLAGSSKVHDSKASGVEALSGRVSGSFNRTALGLNSQTDQGPKAAALVGAERSKHEQSDDHEEKLKAHYEKRNQMVRDYNKSYEEWRTKSRELFAKIPKDQNYSPEERAWEDHQKAKPQQPKLPRAPSKKRVATTKLSPEMQVARGKGVNSTIEHEALHHTMDSMAQHYGKDAASQVTAGLLSHFDKDTLGAVGDYVSGVGYKRSSPHFDEELLTHARDILVNPKKREAFKKFVGDKADQHIKNLKAGHQKAYEWAKNLKPSDLGKSEELEKGAKGDWQKGGYSIHIEPIDKQSNPKSDTFFAIARLGSHEIGRCMIGHHSDGAHIMPFTSEVHPDHQRKGLATAMYKEAERVSGKTLIPESDGQQQTDDAKALWNQKDRPFGKSEESLDKIASIGHSALNAPTSNVGEAALAKPGYTISKAKKVLEDLKKKRLKKADDDGEDPYVTIQAHKVKPRTYGYETASSTKWVGDAYVKMSQAHDAIKELKAKHGPVRITVYDKNKNKINLKPKKNPPK